MISGDFFLYCEPDSPFCPETSDDALSLWVTEIPLLGDVDIDASPVIGSADLILEHAQRQDAE